MSEEKENDVREHPILFTGAMVRAILEGRKTQTRRPIKVQSQGPDWTIFERPYWAANDAAVYGQWREEMRAPFAVGDRLWVRETWTVPPGSTARAEVVYRADDEELPGPWTPSIHMPRWVSRITLEVTDIRPERVKAITEADAIAEGAEQQITAGDDSERTINHRSGFRELWDSIYGKGPLAWANNPWVWTTTFRRIEAGK